MYPDPVYMYYPEMEIESRETAAVVDDMAESVHSDVEDHEVRYCAGFDDCVLIKFPVILLV